MCVWVHVCVTFILPTISTRGPSTPRVQTDLAIHSASSKMNTWGFPGVKTAERRAIGIQALKKDFRAEYTMSDPFPSHRSSTCTHLTRLSSPFTLLTRGSYRLIFLMMYKSLPSDICACADQGSSLTCTPIATQLLPSSVAANVWSLAYSFPRGPSWLVMGIPLSCHFYTRAPIDTKFWLK